MVRGIHGDKIVATLESEKLPSSDKNRVKTALEYYDNWIDKLNHTSAESLELLITRMVNLLNDYKNYIDINLIYDSEEDFLYRQKGQLKLDNTVIEEFLPILVQKCLTFEKKFEQDINIGSQTATFSSVHFTSSLSIPTKGGGIVIKTKDQDFAMSRKLYIKSSYDSSFPDSETETVYTNIGYILAEIKTNLDKTMFQEASATAHDIKLAVSGAKYYLLCDFLDMTPISTTTTDIEEILILRKAKRISSNIRKDFNTFEGRQRHRDWYINYLISNPYSSEIFARFINHILAQIKNESLVEDNVLSVGYF